MGNLDGIHAEPHIVNDALHGFLFVERRKLLDVADVFQAGFEMLLGQIEFVVPLDGDKMERQCFRGFQFSVELIGCWASVSRQVWKKIPSVDLKIPQMMDSVGIDALSFTVI